MFLLVTKTGCNCDLIRNVDNITLQLAIYQLKCRILWANMCIAAKPQC